MEYGHIVLAKRKGNILSSLTAFFTGSQYSHAFTTIVTCNRLLDLEAEAQGVTAGPFDIDYQNDSSRIYTMYSVNIPEKAKKKGLNAVMDKLETGYGYLQMPWFIWRWVCKKFGKDIKGQDNWFYSNGSLCSQLVVEYLMAAGYEDLFEGFGKGSVSPQDVLEIMDKNSNIFTKIV